MIFVTLGTNDKSFARLLQAVEDCVHKGIIQDKVVVQAGYTKYTSDCMEIFDYIERDHFASLIKEADLVIAHGGAGSLMTALKEHKKVLGAARLERYGEHVNDHQVQLLEAFDEKGYILYVKDLEPLPEYIQKAGSFTPAEFVSNREHMVSLIRDWIETNV
ncbi:MAG: hypothetical protein IKE36_09845 [Solobacterium sp.]|nr:hypothetical protein [Solobacterium sp.]